MIGEVLLYTVKTCVGPIVYTETVHNGWAKIYSKMLDTIVPIAVTFELDHKNWASQAADKRFEGQSKSEAAVTTLSVITHTKHSNSINDGSSFVMNPQKSNIADVQPKARVGDIDMHNGEETSI